ncbi:TPA: restriction endonuclease subunit S [Vibrio cholerae]|nr:restriction endonuclease subunit S [Vibrio cholerae]
MTGRYKAYPEYKDSGVEWVGDIPASWTVKPTFSVFDPSVKKNIEGQESTVLSLSYGHIVERDVDTNFGLLPESFNTYQIVRDGDLILRLTDLQNDKKSLRVGLVKQTGIITSAYLKLRSNQSIDSRFAYRLLHSYDTTKVFYGMGGGLRQSMKFEDFRRLPILVPPLEEQQKIASFLDHETAKIDILIAKQEKLIELLKEKRQAVISHAVTKGLNPDAPMKDSGVEWLGEVPEHWVVAGFKRFLSSIVDYRGKTPNKVDSGKFLITARNIKKGTIDYSLSQEYVSEEEYLSVMSRGLPEVGDVLFTTEAPLGEVAQIDKTDIALAQRIVKFRGEENVLDNTFLKYFIMSSSFQDSLGMFASGSTALGIKAERLVYLRQLIPPLSEQHQIVEHIRNVEDKLNALEVKATDAIELMKERKTALISAAVTGKIDVRDWEPQGVQG